MSYQTYLIIHIFAAFLMAGTTYGALAAPLPERRRQTMIRSGIVALLVVVSGFGLLGLGGHGFPGWVFVKIACWLVLAMLTGLAYRLPGQADVLRIVTGLAVLVAIVMVVLKPF